MVLGKNTKVQIYILLLAIILLGVGIVRGYRRTRRPAFRTLILLTCYALLQFSVIRILPYLGYA